MAKYYPQALTDTDLHPARVKFEVFERSDTKTSSFIDDIYLYMPESAINPQSITWDNSKFGYGGNLLSSALTSTGDVWSGNQSVQAAIENAKAGAGEMTDALATRAGISANSVLSSILASEATGEDVFAHVSGRIPNPYIVKIFRGQDFRTFGFIYKFAPYNVADCSVIDDIIQTFRAYSLPDHSSNATFLDYPMEFMIEYQWVGGRNQWLHKFKRSVLQTVNVNYTSQGMFSVHRNGFPTCIELTLSFTEIEKLFRADVMDGY